MDVDILVRGFGCVAGAVAASVGAATLVQRYVPVSRRQENNDVAGVAFAIIGVLYAILLTFVTISVWETNDGAEESSRREARAVVDLNRYADTLPEAERLKLRQLTERYVHIVVRDEWPRMARGETPGPAGGETVNELWRAVDRPAPAADATLARQVEARADLRALGVARDERLAAIDAGLPSVMWLALLLGAGLALVNALMFGVQGSGEYLTIIAMLAAMSALMLFAVYEMEYPYQRGESVGVEAFSDVVSGNT